MSNNPDPDTLASELLGDTDAGTGSNGQPVDYEAKYKGLNKPLSKALGETAELKKQIEAQNKQLAEILAKLQTAPQEKPTEKKPDDPKPSTSDNSELAEMKRMISEIAARDAETTKKLQAEMRKQEARKVVAKDFKSLVDMFDDGDLKSPDDFASSEQYAAYLKRTAERVAEKQTTKTPDSAPVEAALDNSEFINRNALPPQFKTTARQYLAGRTPSVSVGSRQTRQRTLAEIQDEMDALDVKDPKFKEKETTLILEMDTALEQMRK